MTLHRSPPVPVRRALTTGLAGVALLAATGCGPADAGPDRITTAPVGASAAPVLHTGTATVLESPEHGPELCLGGMADSLPPQCGGVPLRGWDWDAVEGEESVSGTTWGSYRVTGRYDGDTLTLTEPASRPESSEPGAAPEDPFATPCPVPDGGWRVVGPGPTGQEGTQAAVELARAAPDFAGLWIDQPPPGDGPDPGVEAPPPEQVVLNVAFTGDLARHEAELREVWAGPLCVSRLPRRYAELTALQDELVLGGAAEELGLQPLGSSTDEVRGLVRLQVVAFTTAQQAAVEDRYGDAVELSAGLQPVG